MLAHWENQQNKQTLNQINQKAERDHTTNKIRNEKKDIKTDIEEIKRIIRSFYNNLYSKKLENIKDMEILR